MIKYLYLFILFLFSGLLFSQNNLMPGLFVWKYSNEPVKKVADNYDISYFMERADGDPEFFDDKSIIDKKYVDLNKYYIAGTSLFVKRNLNYFKFLKPLKPVMGLDLLYLKRINGLKYSHESEFSNDTMSTIFGRLSDESDMLCLSFLLDFHIISNKYFSIYLGMKGGYGISFNNFINEQVTKNYYLYNEDYPNFRQLVTTDNSLNLNNDYGARSYFVVKSSIDAGLNVHVYKNFHLIIEYSLGYFDEGSFSGAKMGYNFVQFGAGIYYNLVLKEKPKPE
ncbi:MAG: hypothetical protein ABIJ97_15375 [Bacteroidota bacterium]